jgi:CheY-like chemotaxis protein
MSYVLVVDDDLPTCRTISLILSTEGIKSKAVSSSAEALALIKQEQPALVILDYLMPGIDPSSLVRDFSGLGYDGKVLLCTALDGEPAMVADGLVKKPFEPDDLMEAVKALI